MELARQSATYHHRWRRRCATRLPPTGFECSAVDLLLHAPVGGADGVQLMTDRTHLHLAGPDLALTTAVELALIAVTLLVSRPTGAVSGSTSASTTQTSS